VCVVYVSAYLCIILCIPVLCVYVLVVVYLAEMSLILPSGEETDVKPLLID
jgi:hypothetical protein